MKKRDSFQHRSSSTSQEEEEEMAEERDESNYQQLKEGAGIEMKTMEIETTNTTVCTAAAQEYKRVYLNDQEKNEALEYCSNVVITSKYTAYSFLPIFLFESFKKVHTCSPSY